MALDTIYRYVYTDYGSYIDSEERRIEAWLERFDEAVRARAFLAWSYIDRYMRKFGFTGLSDSQRWWLHQIIHP